MDNSFACLVPRLICYLDRANALTADHATALHARVDAGDAHVKNIFLKYENDKDVYQLIDALKALHKAEDAVAQNEVYWLIQILLCIFSFYLIYFHSG